MTAAGQGAPKVLLVGPAFSGGGAEGRFARIAGRLFGGVCDVAVFKAGSQPPAKRQGMTRDLAWRGSHSYPRIILALAAILRREHYDVIMAFGMFPNLTAVLATRLSFSGTRVIIHEITRPIKALENSQRPKKLLYRFLQNVVYPRADLVTANSIDGLEETLQICPRLRASAVRLENVIDRRAIEARAAAPSTTRLPPGPYFVCIARLDFMKRIDTVIEAFACISDRTAVNLVIVGDGEASASLHAQTRQHGLQDRVAFIGHMHNPLGVLRRAAGFVLASEYEGFSNTVLEAMSLDVPVVTSFCSSDAREMCNEGVALGFEVGDLEGLAQHLLLLSKDAVVADTLRRKARIYSDRHTTEAAIPRYEQLIRMVAGLDDPATQQKIRA